MKTLYFDIDGTILGGEPSRVKPALAAGALERAIRGAGFAALVCVGNFAMFARAARLTDAEFDAMAALFRLCGGAFADLAWLRAHTTLVADPFYRAEHIDYDGDWWYVDDLAGHYLRMAGREALLRAELRRRVCIPRPDGDGEDLREWLETVAAGGAA